MQFKKLFTISILISLSAFGVSYLASTSINEKGLSFPNKVFAQYEIENNKLNKSKTLEYDVEGITSFSISAVSSEIKIIPSDSKKLIIITNGDKNSKNFVVTADELSLNLDQHNDNVDSENIFIINVDKENDSFEFSYTSANIIVKVPKSISSLTIKNSSGDINLRDVELENVKMEVISGNIKIRSPRISTVNLKTVSGDIDSKIEKGMNSLNAISTSGDVKIRPRHDNKIVNLSINTTSGDTDIVITKEVNNKHKTKNWVITTVSGDIE